MRKNTLITGIVLFVIGLIMWIIGGNAYGNLYYQSQLSGIFGVSSQYDAPLVFWLIFTFIGFILFIIGIIVSIAGALLHEKIIPVYQHPQPVMQQQMQSQAQNTQVKRCPECGTETIATAKFCLNCGKQLL